MHIAVQREELFIQKQAAAQANSHLHYHWFVRVQQMYTLNFCVASDLIEMMNSVEPPCLSACVGLRSVAGATAHRPAHRHDSIALRVIIPYISK